MTVYERTIAKREAEIHDLRRRIDSAEAAWEAQVDANGELTDRWRAAMDALAAVHDHMCGCDRPGSLAVCVARPVDAFTILDTAKGGQMLVNETTPDTPDTETDGDDTGNGDDTEGEGN